MQSFNKLKVIELASVLAGPAVGQFFAELGADVIKIENVKSGGDVTRSWRSPGEKTDDRSAYFSCVNWGKKSVALDLHVQAGRQKLYSLVSDTDVVIASFKPGDAQKLAADFETLQKFNRRLIYAEISGYGARDARVGYDAVIQAESGFMSINGSPGGPALKMPVALMDLLAAHHLKEGILVALIDREVSGEGRKVDVSLFDAAIASLANQGSNWLVAGNPPRRQGSLHPNIAPYGEVLTTRDGKQVLLAIGNDKQFASLLEVLGLKALEGDERFISNENRVRYRTELEVFLLQSASCIDASGLIAEIQKRKIPAGMIMEVSDALQSQPAAELMMESSDMKGIRTLVARFNGDWFSPHSLLPPPHLGEHTTDFFS
jgi:crotonobetainyl-CoA:carnitine CoA-transferase CaiB-like acyl-CoA transferase